MGALLGRAFKRPCRKRQRAAQDPESLHPESAEHPSRTRRCPWRCCPGQSSRADEGKMDQLAGGHNAPPIVTLEDVMVVSRTQEPDPRPMSLDSSPRKQQTPQLVLDLTRGRTISSNMLRVPMRPPTLDSSIFDGSIGPVSEVSSPEKGVMSMDLVCQRKSSTPVRVAPVSPSTYSCGSLASPRSYVGGTRPQPRAAGGLTRRVSLDLTDARGDTEADIRDVGHNWTSPNSRHQKPAAVQVVGPFPDSHYFAGDRSVASTMSFDLSGMRDTPRRTGERPGTSTTIGEDLTLIQDTPRRGRERSLVSNVIWEDTQFDLDFGQRAAFRRHSDFEAPSRRSERLETQLVAGGMGVDEAKYAFGRRVSVDLSQAREDCGARGFEQHGAREDAADWMEDDREEEDRKVKKTHSRKRVSRKSSRQSKNGGRRHSKGSAC